MIKESKVLPGLFIRELENHEDPRGDNVEVWNNTIFPNVEFKRDMVSVTSKHVLRGIHRDPGCYKLMTCLYGKSYYVIVDCNKKSHTFGMWDAYMLSDKSRLQILVPPQYGNTFVALSDVVVMHYKMSELHNPELQESYKWNNPQYNIWWPIKNPILSRRDE